MRYRCEAVSVEGFIQQLAVAYVARGYVFYVTGRIPAGKDRRRVDEKLVERYQLDLSKWARARRKQLGQASMQYLRHEDFFVLLATHGEHRFFELEGANIRDLRRRSLKYAGYAVAFRGGHVQVRIDLPQYRLLKAWFEEEATRRSAESLARAFYDLPFEPYYLVRRQEFNLLRTVNRRRKAAGLRLVPKECIWLKRRPVKPFGEASSAVESAPAGPDAVPVEVGTVDTDRDDDGPTSVG
ncbi:MAG: hypothetical protein ABGY75_08790 [Gemmataceae bacterium]